MTRPLFGHGQTQHLAQNVYLWSPLKVMSTQHRLKKSRARLFAHPGVFGKWVIAKGLRRKSFAYVYPLVRYDCDPSGGTVHRAIHALHQELSSSKNNGFD
jgi:hypothetical protein